MFRILNILIVMFFTSLGLNAQTSNAVSYKNSFLVDVRTPEEFKEGSAPGAVNIPLNELSAHLNDFKGKKNIVVFCRSGNRSSMAKQYLESQKISNVINGGTWLDVTAKLKAENKK